MTKCNRQHAEVIEAQRMERLQGEWKPVSDATGALIVDVLRRDVFDPEYYVSMDTTLRKAGS